MILCIHIKSKQISQQIWYQPRSNAKQTLISPRITIQFFDSSSKATEKFEILILHINLSRAKKPYLCHFRKKTLGKKIILGIFKFSKWKLKFYSDQI